MTIPTKKPGDLMMAVHHVLEEERHSPLSRQQGLLDIEPLSMGEWTGEVAFIKRDDTGR